MSIFDRILQGAQKAIPFVVSSGSHGVPQYPEIDIREAVKQGYKSNPVVFATVQRIAMDFSSALWVVKRTTRDGSGRVVPDSHPAARTIRNPNPYMGQPELMEHMISSQMVTGNAYWHVSQPIGNGRRALWPLRSDRVKIVPDAKSKRRILHFEYSVGGEIQKFRPDEIIFFPYNQAFSDWYGMSPIQPGARNLVTFNNLLDWQRSQSEKQGILSAIISPKRRDVRVDVEKLMDKIRSALAGPSNARTIGFIPFEMDFTQLELNPVEVDFINSLMAHATYICAVFGVDPLYVGFPIQSTYNNKRESRVAAWEDVIIPRLELVKHVLNTQLAPKFSDNIWFDYDISHVPAYQDLLAKQVDRARKLVELGMPANQALREVGAKVEPFPAGDFPYVATNLRRVDVPYTDDSEQQNES